MELVTLLRSLGQLYSINLPLTVCDAVPRTNTFFLLAVFALELHFGFDSDNIHHQHNGGKELADAILCFKVETYKSQAVVVQNSLTYI